MLRGDFCPEASRREAARPFGRVEALAQGDIDVDFEKALSSKQTDLQVFTWRSAYKSMRRSTYLA
jgi:hypothetical protein